MKDKIKLTKEEKMNEKALEKGEYTKSRDLKKTQEMFKEAAANYSEMSKTKSITIRVNNEDLIKVKAKAKKNNVPYQTLLNVVIRQFAEGKTLIQL